MPRIDTNARTAGRTRPSARAERTRVKQAWVADQTPLAPMADWTADTLVLLLASPTAPTPDHVRRAAAEALGTNARVRSTDGTVRHAAWELGVRWANRRYNVNRAVNEHAGWVAVELLAAPTGATTADRLGRVGRLLCALAATAAVAIVRPATDDVCPVTPDVAALLAEGRVADAFAA